MLTALYVKARNVMASDEGATALEYGVLVTMIIVLLAAGALVFGKELQTFFANLFPTIVTPTP